MRARGWTVITVLCATGASLVAQGTRPATQPTSAPGTAPTTVPATAPVATSEPADALKFPPAEDVLRQLSSGDRRQRRATQEMLVRGGEAARPYLLELIRRADNPEARKNAEAALAEIESNRFVGPSYITLHVKDASPRDVFAEISRQCHAPLLTYPDNLWDQGTWPKVTLDIDRKMFWEVLPEVCQKANVDFRQFQNGMRIMQSGGVPAMQGISQVQGPFLIIASQITRTQTRFLGGNQMAQSQFGMHLTVHAEPKITVLRTNGGVRVDEAVDDHGNSLVATDGATRNFWGSSGMSGTWSLYAVMHFPEKNPGTKITRFRGSTTFVIQTKADKFVIDNALNLRETTKTVNGTQVTFKDVKKVGDAFQLHLRIAQPNFGGAEWQQLVESVQTRLQLQDAAGNAFDHRGMSSSGSNNAVDMTLDFGRFPRPDGRALGDPAKIVWEIPTATKEVNVPIEFRDLPLF